MEKLMELKASDNTRAWLGKMYEGDPFTTLFVEMADGTMYTIKSISAGTGIARWKPGDVAGEIVPDASMVLAEYDPTLEHLS